MYRAKEKITNDDLFCHTNCDLIFDAKTCITGNRPLKDIDEVIGVAESLSNMLAFLQHATAGDRQTVLNSDVLIDALKGQEQVLELAPILSRRVEQYLGLLATRGGSHEN